MAVMALLVMQRLVPAPPGILPWPGLAPATGQHSRQHDLRQKRFLPARPRWNSAWDAGGTDARCNHCLGDRPAGTIPEGDAGALQPVPGGVRKNRERGPAEFPA